MNREFMKKMLLAKRMEYDALKEIMPHGMRRQVEELESNAKEMVKELAYDMFMGMPQSGSNSMGNAADSEPKHTSKVEVEFDGDEQKKQTRKINVEY